MSVRPQALRRISRKPQFFCGRMPLYGARRGIVAARRNALFAGVVSAGAVEEASRVLSAFRGRVRRGIVLRRVFDDL